MKSHIDMCMCLIISSFLSVCVFFWIICLTISLQVILHSEKESKRAQDENICIFKVLFEAPVFSSSENDTFALEETTIWKKNTNLPAV